MYCVSHSSPEKRNQQECVCVCEEIYYKRLAYMIMKAKSQDLQLASRRAHGLSSSLKAGRLKTQEEPMFQFGSKSIKKKKKKKATMSQLSCLAGGVSLL